VIRGVHFPAGKRRRLLAALCAFLLLAGCAGEGDKLFKRAVAPPPPAQVEAGSTFTLTAPLTIPPDANTLYFQDNQIVELVSLARDMPYCALSPASPASPRRLEPRAFAVRSVEYDDRRSNVSGQTSDVTRIALAANATQPYTMNCQWPPGAPSQSFLTSEEIIGAIAAYFTMNLQR
jgi:hypothetical protein